MQVSYYRCNYTLHLLRQQVYIEIPAQTLYTIVVGFLFGGVCMRLDITMQNGVVTGYRFVGQTSERVRLAQTHLDTLFGLSAANPTHFGYIWDNVLRAAADTSLMLAALLESGTLPADQQNEVLVALTSWRIRLLVERNNRVASTGLSAELAGRSLLPGVAYFRYDWDRLLGP